MAPQLINCISRGKSIKIALMPILWRYLLRSYFQVFSLCVTGFIAVLLVTRFQDIARFAATGASKGYLLLFILYQIPFILPLAIPISCLIAALLLFQNMSRAHELTAMRAAGLGIFPLALPIVLSAILLAFGNFMMASEIGPKCRAHSKSLAYAMTVANPLCVLSKDALIKLKDTYVDLHSLKQGRSAKDVLLVQRNLSHERLGIILAKELKFEGDELIGKEVALISSMAPKFPPGTPENFDHLVIENQSLMRTKASELLQYLRSTDWNFGEDYLPLRLLRAKEKHEPGRSGKASQEIARRFSLALAPLTFTLIGLGFGMEIGRRRKLKPILWAIALAGFYMVAFMAARSMKHDPFPSILCYLLPHPLIALISLFALRKVAKGVE